MIFLLLVSGLLWYRWWRYQAQHFFKKQSTVRYPDTKKLFIKNIEEGIFQSVILARAAQQLRKQTPIATEQLDMNASIKQIIQAGGWFTPITDFRKNTPEYLVLIDRSTFPDHHYHLINALVNQLIAQGVFMTRYYFDGDPRHCYPEKTELAPVLLTELADRYPEYRLMIFSEGKDFINPITGDIVSWIEQFSVWTQRIFFTLKTPEQWSYQEKLLTQANFLLLPANENGFTALVKQIKTESWQTSNILQKDIEEDLTESPVFINQFPDWWLERYSPARATVTELLTQLRNFLGTEGYYWFSACAVYPELHWQLTLYLGYNLRTADGKPLLTEKCLAKLARLPWFRYGAMPEWLRKRLIQDLPLSQEQEIRTALQALLLSALEKPVSNFYLEIAKQPKITLLALIRQLLSRFSKQAEII